MSLNNLSIRLQVLIPLLLASLLMRKYSPEQY